MPNKKNDQKLNTSAYDDLPYESYPFSYARAEHMRTVGIVFGMQPPALENARILELGCAAGGNLLNFAEAYPKSYTLGVDLSKVQIEQGKSVIKAIGLKNIELKHQSITELDESMEKFDYIICHGVFSWVPEFVREKILDLSKKLLSPNGIAFISYNTLPGWNMISTMRDMMLFHSEIFKEPMNKLNQAKLFLKFTNEALEGSNTPYSNFLQLETEKLLTREDSYLAHEYLEEENVPFYFQDFMRKANSHGLTYVGDSDIFSMYLGNLPEKVSEKLQAVGEIVRTEQYMDFLQNRRFRGTLLTHAEAKLVRDISPELINTFYLTCSLTAEKLEKEIDITSNLESLKFSIPNSADISISTSSPYLKAVFYTFIENEGNPLTVDELVKLAHKKLPSVKLEVIAKEFDKISGKLVFSGYVKLFFDKPKTIAKISNKPKVNELVHYQVKNLIANKPWVTNRINQIFVLQHHEKFVLEKLDGKHTLEEIAEYIFENFENGTINALEGENKINDKITLKNVSKQCVELALERFRTNYLLIG